MARACGRRPRWRSRWRSRCSDSPARRARPPGARAPVLAGRERLGRRPDRPARPDRLAAVHRRPRAADRLRHDGDAGVPLELGDWRLVTVDSGETHSLAAGGYNERRAECEEAARRLGVADAQRGDGRGGRDAPGDLRRRAGTCSARTRAWTRRSRRCATRPGGGRALLDDSHASLRDNYDASTDAVEATVRALHGAAPPARAWSAAASAATSSRSSRPTRRLPTTPTRSRPARARG